MVSMSAVAAGLEDRGIDVKDHRHLGALAGLQGLLVEAEALDLVEIRASLIGGDVEGGEPVTGRFA